MAGLVSLNPLGVERNGQMRHLPLWLLEHCHTAFQLAPYIQPLVGNGCKCMAHHHWRCTLQDPMRVVIAKMCTWLHLVLDKQLMVELQRTLVSSEACCVLAIGKFCFGAASGSSGIQPVVAGRKLLVCNQCQLVIRGVAGLQVKFIWVICAHG